MPCRIVPSLLGERQMECSLYICIRNKHSPCRARKCGEYVERRDLDAMANLFMPLALHTLENWNSQSEATIKMIYKQDPAIHEENTPRGAPREQGVKTNQGQDQ